MARQGSQWHDRANGGGAFGPLGHPATAIALAVSWIVLLIFFRVFDSVDPAVSRLFFDAEACAATAGPDGCAAGFPLSRSPLLASVRVLLHPLPQYLGLALMALLTVALLRGRRWRDVEVRLLTVLSATLIIGPLLLVNNLLKEVWGRPRPRMTEEFGGSMPFIEAGTWSDFCSDNCSFVSGEASGAGWLMCIALLLILYGHRVFGWLFAIAALIMAALRVAFGAHYLSDAVLGFLLTLVVFAALAVLSERIVSRRTRSG